jgi:hypothetical protein
VLFFAAGIDDESHGLFGSLTASNDNEDNHDQGDENGRNGNKRQWKWERQ